VNVAAYLKEQASARPDQDAIRAHARGLASRISFAELDRRSDALALGFDRYGIGRGVRTLVMVRAGVELITLTYALLKAGAVPVLIDPGMGLRGFLRCVADTEPTAFVGIPLAQLVRQVFRSPFRTIERVVTVGPRVLWGGATLGELEAGGGSHSVTMDERDPAAILFTSESTGPAKGALYAHGHFCAQVEVLKTTYGFRAGEIDLAAFPLFSLFDGALGMTSVIPDLDPARPGRCNPALVVAALVEERCTSAFGSPAIWRRVAPYCLERGIRFEHLKRILIAGASVPPSLIEMLHQLLPADGDVHTPYGATEALPVATIAGREVVAGAAEASREGRGTCVGRPVGRVEVRIIRISDDPIRDWDPGLELPAGQVGEICVRGTVVTRAYAGRDEATRQAKIADGESCWHRMGDLGYFDPVGRLWFAGRKAERVRTTAGALFTDLVESRIANVAGVGRCALVGVGAPEHERPVAVIEGPGDDALAARVKAVFPFEAVLFHPRFPVDVRHNAKIHRLELKRWATDRLARA
jgi:acyl-CoA synthetase (AMP-forming)/AMP-acid ligase II